VNTKAIGLTVAVVVLLLVAIVVLVIFWARRKKHSDSQPSPKRSATSPATKPKRQ
jgi:predicted lipid-binding transport protein (Tim44 family)